MQMWLILFMIDVGPSSYTSEQRKASVVVWLGSFIEDEYPTDLKVEVRKILKKFYNFLFFDLLIGRIARISNYHIKFKFISLNFRHCKPLGGLQGFSIIILNSSSFP
jgi:hypothetical protein